MDCDVALQVVAIVPAPQQHERLERTQSEAEVRSESDGYVDVEDSLTHTLDVRFGSDEEGERHPQGKECAGQERQPWNGADG